MTPEQMDALALDLHMKLPMATQEDAIEFARRFLAECERDQQNDINYGLEKADHERTKEQLASVTKQRDELVEALKVAERFVPQMYSTTQAMQQVNAALAKVGAGKEEECHGQ